MARSGSVSCSSASGALHVRPPSMERDTSMARSAVVSLKAYAIWYAVPLAANVTHGSLARSKAPPAHCENATVALVQVWPESNEAALTFPLAPPLFQRSCCQTAIRLLASVGLTASCGSTSALA